MKLRKLTGRQIDKAIYVAFWVTLVGAIVADMAMVAITAYVYLSTM